MFRCNKWAKLCHRFDLVDNAYGKCNNSQRLCSIHFEPHCYSSTGKLCDRAIPSIFSWTVKCAGTDHQKHTSSMLIVFILIYNEFGNNLVLIYI